MTNIELQIIGSVVKILILVGIIVGLVIYCF